MVVIDFMPDPAEIARTRTDSLMDLTTEHPGMIALATLVMGLGLNVNGVQLMAEPPLPNPDFAVGTPLLDFAVSIRASVRDAWQTGSASYTYPDSWGELRMERVGEEICLWRYPEIKPKQVGCALYTELRDACEAFAWKVRTYVSAEVPELLQNPYWGAWLRGAGLEDIPLP